MNAFSDAPNTGISDNHSNPFQAGAERETSFFVAPAPDWIWEREVQWEMPLYSDEHVSLLLSDTHHSPKRLTTYERNVRRLNTTEAVQKLSQIEIDYDPETQQLVVHELRVWRQGQFQSYADPNRFFFRQRENSLETHILDGKVSAMLVLDHVRTGDILDLSYSLITIKELPGKKTDYSFTLDRPLPTAAWHVTLHFAKGDQPPRYRHAGEEARQPEVFETEDEYLWVWSGSRDQLLIEEFGVPIWEPLLPWGQVSAYESWEEVAAILHASWKEIWTGHTVDAAEIDPEAAGAPLEARILRLIRMVQDDVRYLGLAMGLGGILPSSPGEVLRRRYGDCKDKSLLLCSLLRSIGVAAHPVLVHTLFRGTVEKDLPGLFSFNHVIVMYEVEGRRGFADPTMSGSGGGIFNQCLPDYGCGLCIAEGTRELIEIPHVAKDHSRWHVREDFYLDASGGPSCMDQCIEAVGFEANALRARLAQVGRDIFAKTEAEGMQGFFPDIRQDPGTPLLVTDDRDQNHIMIEGRFLFSKWGELLPSGSQLFRYNARWLGQFLSCPPQHPPRKNNFMLCYPLKVHHEVTIHGTVLAGPPEDHHVDCQWFQSRTRVKMTDNRNASFTYLFLGKQKTVPAAWVPEYIKQFEKMASQAGCNVQFKRKRARNQITPYVRRKPALLAASASSQATPPPPQRHGLPAGTPPPLPRKQHETPANVERFEDALDTSTQVKWGMGERLRWQLRQQWWLILILVCGLTGGIIGALKKSLPREPAPHSQKPLPQVASPISTQPIQPIQDHAFAVAEEALRRGDLTTALANLTELEKKYPGHPSLHIGRGFLELHRQNGGEARKHAEEALRKAPDAPMALLILGNADLLQKNFKEAEAVFSSLTRRHPDLIDAWQGLVKAYGARGMLAESEEANRKILALNPVHGEALRNGLFFHLNRGDKDGALALIRSGIEKAPGAAFLHVLHADLLDELGNHEEQLAALEEALKLSPGDPACVVRKGRALGRLGRKEEAVEVLNASLVVAADRFEINDIAGMVYSELGKKEEAVKAHEKCVELQPGQPLARNRLGYSLLQAGDTARAKVQFEKAIELDPGLIVAWENLRNLAQQAGDQPNFEVYSERIRLLKGGH